MSEMLLSILITVGILATLFVWVPLLHICDAGCRHLFLRRKAEQPIQAEASAETFEDAA